MTEVESENSESLTASIVTEKWNFRYSRALTQLTDIRPDASTHRFRGSALSCYERQLVSAA
ncbi:hypothetical protein CBM2623_U40022 [Cupriavidus taiwanensis]|nr:hypothetical protein CBM2623_U40022 [Cupriavidus taiwanensis]